MRTDLGRMLAAAARIEVYADEFWDDVENLRREAEAVMDDSWRGDAADSHAALWWEWVESARRVTVALSDDATLLRRAAAEYESVDRDTARDVDSAGAV